MSRRQLPTWVSLLFLGAGLLAVAIPGLFVYMRLSATKVYPDTQAIPSVVRSSPSQWAAATDRARQSIRTTMSENNLAGVSVAVGVDGELVWIEGFGFIDSEKTSPVTPDHRFRTGTASITFTSAAIGLLLDEGKLKLEDEIQHYVPAFPTKQWPVTIRQLMGDVSGLIGEDPDNGVLTSSHCERAADAVALVADLPMPSPPGTEFRDSTFGWVLLSAAVESVAGKPFVEFLDERVFRPLGMVDTFKESAAKPPASAATSYNPRFAANPIYGLRELPQFDYSCHAGSNGFLSTPTDLARFGMAIQGGKLLRKETVQALQAPQRLAPGQQTSYGLGWALKNVTLAGQQVQAAGHNGHFWSEDVSSLLTFPGRGLTVAVMTNVSFAGTSSMAESIASAFAE